MTVVRLPLIQILLDSARQGRFRSREHLVGEVRALVARMPASGRADTALTVAAAMRDDPEMALVLQAVDEHAARYGGGPAR